MARREERDAGLSGRPECLIVRNVGRRTDRRHRSDSRRARGDRAGRHA